MNVPNPAIIFLERASARLILVRAGEMDPHDAVAGLADAFHWLVPCACTREIMDRWERAHPPRKRRKAVGHDL
jgi:hypothetical protein